MFSLVNKEKENTCLVSMFFSLHCFIGLPKEHPESYHYFMWNNFFKHIDIQPKNVHILNGNAVDLEKECEDYEKKILEAGGIHLFIGGEL